VRRLGPIEKDFHFDFARFERTANIADRIRCLRKCNKRQTSDYVRSGTKHEIVLVSEELLNMKLGEEGNQIP